MDFTNIGNFNYQISNVPKVSKKEELVTKMFPGFTDKQVKQLYKDTALVPADKRQEVQQQMYRAILPKLKERDKQEQRTIQKNALYNDVLDEKDTQKVKIKQSAIRVADLADEVRKTVGPIKENDDEIVKKVIDNTPNGKRLFQKYINDGDEEFLYQAGIKERPEPTISPELMAGIGTTALGVPAAYGVGKGLESLGEGIYGLTLPPGVDEARAIQTYEAGLGPKPIKTTESAIERNITGTRSKIGTKAQKEANKIFTETINPMLDKSQTKTNVQQLIKSLEGDIEKFAKGDPDKLAEYKEAIKEMKKSFSGKKFSELSQKELHELKSGLQGRTPQKFFKGKEITNAYQELRGKLSSKLVGELHGNLTKEFGENTAKLYKDYANLQGLKEVGVKSRSAAGLKGGFGGFWSTIAQELSTPATTVGGKGLYEIGKILQKPAQITMKVIKNIAKVGKGVLSADPTGILSNIIENEIYTKDLKGSQFDVRNQMVTSGMDKEEATKEAKKIKPEENFTYL